MSDFSSTKPFTAPVLIGRSWTNTSEMFAKIMSNMSTSGTVSVDFSGALIKCKWQDCKSCLKRKKKKSFCGKRNVKQN